MNGAWTPQRIPATGRWVVYRIEVRYDSLGREAGRQRVTLAGLYGPTEAAALARLRNASPHRTGHPESNQEERETAMTRARSTERTAVGKVVGKVVGTAARTGADFCRQCQIHEVEVRAARLCRSCYNRMRRMGLTTKLGWCECSQPAKVIMTAYTGQGEEQYALCAACAAEELRTRAVLAGVGLGGPLTGMGGAGMTMGAGR